jgi:DNA-binding NarL/FixJ family response regulator
MGASTGVTAQRGRSALADGRWAEARACFEALVSEDEDPANLEGLGMAARWLLDEPAAVDAHTRAYRLHRRRGDDRGAARMALQLALHAYNFRSDLAVALGWLERARRLLAGIDVPTPEAAWVALLGAHTALLVDHDLPEARRRAEAGTVLGRALGDADLELLGLAQLGLILVSEGRAAEGMPMLDESGAAAIAGDILDVDAIHTIYCYLIYACRRMRDYDRASEWCEQVRRSSERWSDRITFSICRVHYADVLLWRGAWADCESELDSAAVEFQAFSARRVGDATARLGELRRRQGRAEEAERHFAAAPAHPVSILGRAALALERGDPEASTDQVDRYLRNIDPGERTERVPGLEVLVRARLAGGDLPGAEGARDELGAIAAAVGTDSMRAVAAMATGLVAGGSGDRDGARRALEDAADLYERAGAPFEAAIVRRDLATALRALGHADRALEEERAADAVLARLRTAPVPATAGPLDAPDGLTRREREVLALVARGLSNQEIARDLVLSVRTVERHISNIYGKIGAVGRSGRAAAASHAVRLGLT